MDTLNVSDTCSAVPLVSIGVPVYNGEATLVAALDSLVNQSFSDVEIIISDNASNDRTQEICRDYEKRYDRVFYIRQDKNIGATNNFKFVLSAARGKYFMWAAADDVRSLDFVERNVEFLDSNSDCVAATSPNCFEGYEQNQEKWVSFSIDDDASANRVLKFFTFCWQSHAIFYSLMRADVAKLCPILGDSFIAADWAFNLYMLSWGKVHRTEKGFIVFGARGVSSQSGAYRKFRNQPIEVFLPFYRLLIFTLKISRSFDIQYRFRLFLVLIKLNFTAVFDQCYSNLYQFYRKIRGSVQRSPGVE